MIGKYTSLAAFLALVVIAAAAGASFEAGIWYFDMNKPGWAPPAWLYGPMWALVYLCAALAAWTVWQTGHYRRPGALAWWAIVLFLNLGWMALFFGLQRLGWSWLAMGLLVGVTLLCIRAFHGLSRQAAYLMLPFLAWTLYAWALNLAIWSINGGVLGRFGLWD